MCLLAEKSITYDRNAKRPHFEHHHAAAALGVCGQEFHTDRESRPAPIAWWRSAFVWPTSTIKGRGCPLCRSCGLLEVDNRHSSYQWWLAFERQWLLITGSWWVCTDQEAELHLTFHGRIQFDLLGKSSDRHYFMLCVIASSLFPWVWNLSICFSSTLGSEYKKSCHNFWVAFMLDSLCCSNL